MGIKNNNNITIVKKNRTNNNFTEIKLSEKEIDLPTNSVSLSKDLYITLTPPCFTFEQMKEIMKDYVDGDRRDFYNLEFNPYKSWEITSDPNIISKLNLNKDFNWEEFEFLLGLGSYHIKGNKGNYIVTPIMNHHLDGQSPDKVGYTMQFDVYNEILDKHYIMYGDGSIYDETEINIPSLNNIRTLMKHTAQLMMKDRKLRKMYNAIPKDRCGTIMPSYKKNIVAPKDPAIGLDFEKNRTVENKIIIDGIQGYLVITYDYEDKQKNRLRNKIKGYFLKDKSFDTIVRDNLGDLWKVPEGMEYYFPYVYILAPDTLSKEEQEDFYKTVERYYCFNI